MIENVESIAFSLFVISILWFFWFPQRYLIKNARNSDFDFYRDIHFYYEKLKERCRMKIGKVVIIYSALYLLFQLVTAGS